MTIDVSKAVELVNTIPVLGFFEDFIKILIADPDPIKISVIIRNTFFLFNDLYFFLSFHCQF